MRVVYYKLFEIEDGYFGYDIYLNFQKFIHQPHSPNNVNKKMSREEAEKMAKLVVLKLNRHMSPIITREEEYEITRKSK